MTRRGFAGLDPCVHCGFCLQSCPTFLVTGDEADGPRGRIVLMQAMERGELAATDDNLTLHLDRCMGCRACEPACPSGVQYGHGIETARHQIGAARPLPWIQRAVHAVMAEPMLREPTMAVARLARPFAPFFAGESRLGFGMGMLAATYERRERHRTHEKPADDAAHATVFAGCIMSGLFAHVHAATKRTLAVNGYAITEVKGQGCCGALHAHAGQHDQAVALAKANVRALAGNPDAVIVVNSAGCGAMLREYGRLLADDPLADAAAQVSERVRDVTEVLATRGPKQGGKLPLRVAYDPPCHLAHAQRVTDEPERLFDAIPGIQRVHHDEAELCCGSAGSYSLVQPEMSRAVLARKLDALTRVSPDVVVTGNPGCVMQIGAGLRARGIPTPVVHPVELLDWSYSRLEMS